MPVPIASIMAAAGSSRPKPPVDPVGDFDSPAWVVAHAVAFWNMEDAGGDPRLDVTGRGNDLDGGPVSDVIHTTGHVGLYASVFTAADSQYLSRASTSDLQIGAGDFIVATWVKPGALGATRPILGKGQSANGDAEYVLSIASTGQVVFAISVDGGDSVGVAADISDVTPAGVWSLIVARVSPSVSSVRINNGTIATGDGTATPLAMGAAVYIGAQPDAPDFFDGLIDDTICFKSATPLSSDDFNALCVYLWNGGSGQDLSVLFP